MATSEELSPQGPPTCGGQAVPEGWPDCSSSDEELLAPFLRCTSPAEFLELQRRVDMPRVVGALGDWSAVRLGTLGPMRAKAAAEVLNRKRVAFLVRATEEYSVSEAEVFALLVIHSAFTDEVRQVLVLLGQDKRLGQTLGHMPAVREALKSRGVNLTLYADRNERWGDVGRGLARRRWWGRSCCGRSWSPRARACPRMLSGWSSIVPRWRLRPLECPRASGSEAST